MITAKEELDHLLEGMTEERAEYLNALIQAAEDMLENAEIDEGDPSWACGMDEKSASRLIALRDKAIQAEDNARINQARIDR